MSSKKKTHFRTVDEWKLSLMTLPENNFFELLKSILGNIKTPFNKQRLLGDLLVFLSRDEIQKNAAAYINGQDHKIIAAVALLDDPPVQEMEVFFAGELGRAELHALVINLEERLIIYRYRCPKGVLRLSLNPVLEKVLAPFTEDTSVLFPSFEKEECAEEAAVKHDSIFDTRIMAAFFSFISSTEEFFRTEAGVSEGAGAFPVIRKKVIDEGKKMFPVMDFEFAVRALVALGLFRPAGRCLVPDREKIVCFCNLSPIERHEYWTAAVFLCLDEAEKNAQADVFFQGRLRRISSIIHHLLHLFDPQKLYPETTLRRMGYLLEKKDEGNWNFWDTPWNTGRESSQAKTRKLLDSLLEVLEKTGLLEKTILENGQICWKAGPAFAAPARAGAEKSSAEESPVIVMDTAFSVVLYPEISFADALALGDFCSVKGLGPCDKSPNSADAATAAVRFELNRLSVVRGFDQGLSSDDMLELLSRLSGNRIDANLSWTLKDWETRHAGVSLNQGIILTLAEDLHYLAKTKPVAAIIQSTLAPGVYLLSSKERSEAAAALKKAGVDIVAQPLSGSAGKQQFSSFSGGFYRQHFPNLGGSTFRESVLPVLAQADTAITKKPLEAAQSADSIREKFRIALDKMKLGKAEHEELTARIERRLVLSDAQLKGVSMRYEKLEARGLDYAGKSIIAKQAVDFGSMLDVSWSGPGGVTNRIIAKPQALEKKGTENFLILKNSDDPTGDTIRIALGKISLLRRIKQSIFEG